MKNSKFKPFQSRFIADMSAIGSSDFVATCYSINGHSIIANFGLFTCFILVVIASSCISVMHLKNQIPVKT
jgi:hypothetical protein